MFHTTSIKYTLIKVYEHKCRFKLSQFNFKKRVFRTQQKNPELIQFVKMKAQISFRKGLRLSWRRKKSQILNLSRSFNLTWIRLTTKNIQMSPLIAFCAFWIFLAIYLFVCLSSNKLSSPFSFSVQVLQGKLSTINGILSYQKSLWSWENSHSQCTVIFKFFLGGTSVEWENLGGGPIFVFNCFLMASSRGLVVRYWAHDQEV